MLGYEVPSPEAARKFLYQFHDSEKIEQAQRELAVGERSYVPQESAALNPVLREEMESTAAAKWQPYSEDSDAVKEGAQVDPPPPAARPCRCSGERARPDGGPGGCASEIATRTLVPATSLSRSRLGSGCLVLRSRERGARRIIRMPHAALH
jgi:hypothetical protein